MTALGALAHYPKMALDKAVDVMNYVPEPVRELQEDIDPRDSAQEDGLEPAVTFTNFEDKSGRFPLRNAPFNKAQWRGFQAGALDAVNAGNLAQLASMAASGGTTALARLALKAGSTVAPRVAQAASVAARGARGVDAALDYTGIGAGAEQFVEGAIEGSPADMAMGAGFAGLGTLGRVAARPKVEPKTFRNDFAQERPDRPVQTPLERIRAERQFAELFGDETPISPNAINARNAPTMRGENPPRVGTAPITPATPMPQSQPRLAPVDDVPVAVDVPVGSAAQRKAALRDLAPKRQDAGVLPTARPTPVDPATQRMLDQIDQDAKVFDDPEDVVATDDELAQLLRAERQSMGERGELDPDAELAALFEGEQNLSEQQRWKSAREDAAEAQRGDGSEDPATRLVRIIAERGGIKSTDDALLRKTRTSYRPTATKSGELAAVVDHGDGFGRWGGVSGVFRKNAGVHQDVMATDIAREFPEYAGLFNTGDEMLEHWRNLAINRDYRKPKFGKRAVDDAPAPKSDAVVDSQEAQAIRDAKSGNIGGDDSFDFADLDAPTPVAKPSPDPGARKILRGFAEAPAKPSDDESFMNVLEGRRARPKAPVATARYAFDQPDPDGGSFPMYHVDGGPNDRSTVSAERLRELGIAVPEKPVVDTLSTGEAQPRLPEAGRVRDVEVPSPKVADAPAPTFSLAPPPVKAPDQPSLPQGLPEGTPTMRSLPTNVRDYLVKRLGYSPEAVGRMTPDEAIALGKARTPPAEGQGAAPKAKPAPAPSAGAIVQQPSPLSTMDVRLRGKVPVGVRAVDPGKPDSALAGKRSPLEVLEVRNAPAVAAKAKAESEALLARRNERLALEAAGKKPQTERVGTREKGINPRAIDKANAAGAKFVETGDPDAWSESMAGMVREADAAGPAAVKAGYKRSLDTATRVHSNPMADPEMWKTAARVWNKSPGGRFLIGGAVGSYVGHEDDDPWSSTASDFLTGGVIAAFGNRETAKKAVDGLMRLRRGEGWYGDRGVKPVIHEGGQRWKTGVDALSSPQLAVPELRDVQATYEVAEQALRGFDASGKPIPDFKGHATPQDLIAATKDTLKDTRSATRKLGKQFYESAKKAYARGDTALGASEKAKARYVAAVLERLENQPTLSAKAFGGGPKAQMVDRALADLQYGAALLWNFGLGRVLNKTQKWYALNYVPPGAIQKAKKILKTDAGKAATDFLHVERAGLDMDMVDPGYGASAKGTAQGTLAKAKDIWKKVVEKTGGNSLKASDEENRRVVYLAATEYAKSKGGVQAARGFDKSPEAIHRWAMDVVNATQGVVGPMGQSPYISRIGKAATTFTKFSGLTMELALEMANNPRPETLGALGVLGSLMALQELAIPEDYQLDMWKMLGAKVPVGFTREGIPKSPAVNQLGNFWDQLTNDTQSVPERLIRAATPDAPERYVDEIFGEGGFLSEGMGMHRHPNRYGSLDEHSGYDALARMFGMETESNSQRIKTAQQQRNFAARTTEDSAAKNRPARQEARVEKLKRSTPGESARDDTRSKTPVVSRPAYDKRWPKEKRLYGVAP